MEFNPNNNVVKQCLEGMQLEATGNSAEAAKIFFKAWNEAANDFEKFIAAYYVARQQNNIPDRLQWLETTLHFASKVNDESVKAAFIGLYESIAGCYEQLNDDANAKKYDALAKSFNDQPSDSGPFYHGTRADLQIGDLLTPGFNSNYKEELAMNHIYFTALINGAALASALAKGDGHERVYIVEPTGPFENDPNVTNKKFPGNPTRSYRTDAPLKIVGEASDWIKITPQEVQEWRKKLDNNKGAIIN